VGKFTSLGMNGREVYKFATRKVGESEVIMKL